MADNESHEPDPEVWVRHVHSVLRQVFRRAGPGSVGRVEEALGICAGSFRQWRKRGQLELDVLFRALEELGIPPARFWVEVFGSDLDPVQVARIPTGPPKDPVVKRALERWERPEQKQEKEIIEEDLRKLDVLRDEDPRVAIRKAKSALKSAGKVWLPRLLAIYGSARRAEARLDQALEALLYALQLAERGNNRVLCADILQRLGVVYAYMGNHCLGLLYAKAAGYEYQMVGNVRGEGRSWVDQGVRYGHLGRLDNAIAAHTRALARLSENEIRNRFTAYQCLAILYQRQADLHSALNYVCLAEDLGPKVEKGLFARLIWTKAEIAIALTDYAQAERCYAKALEIYRIVSPIDAALAAVELARAQLLQGKLDSARETAKAMISLLAPLKDSAVASESLRELVRIALATERITERLLDHVLQKVKNERTRLVGCSLAYGAMQGRDAHSGIPLVRHVFFRDREDTDELESKEWTRHLHGVLRLVFRRAGPGSVQYVEQALNICHGSFCKWRSRGRLQLRILFQVLEVLEIHPARFWVEIFGSDFDPVQLAKSPTGPPKDPVVRRALERWEMPERRCSTEITEGDLRKLDGRRDEDPKVAVRKAKSALENADNKLLPRLLAIYGSARRAEARLDIALEALQYALQLAERGSDRVLCADILQRLGVTYAYMGDHSLGLLYAKEAGYAHQMADNIRGEGRSCVDQGVRYGHLGQLNNAIAAHKRALSCLPDDEVRNRFTAYQCLAVLYQRQGDHHTALQYVSCAEEFGLKVGKGLFGRLIWTKAEIATTLSDNAQAEECYAEALEIYRTVSPIDAALAAVELARTQVLQGKRDSALETTTAMASLLRTLQNNRVVSEALMRLFRIPLERGRITNRALDRTAWEIRKERARLERRARLRA